MARFIEGEMPAITGVGMSTGSRSIRTNELIQFLYKKPTPDGLEKLTSDVGIEVRNWVESGTPVTDLAVEALLDSLHNSGLQLSDVTSLFLATSSPESYGTNISASVQKKAGLNNTVLGSTNADACPGWVMAAHRAATLLSSPFGTHENSVAVVGAEVISPFLDPKNRATSILFGDAAGSTIFQNVVPDQGAPSYINFRFGADGNYADDLGIYLNETDHIPGEDMRLHPLHMKGSVVYEQAVRRLPQVLLEALNDGEVSFPIEEVDVFIFHQANIQIIKAAADTLGIPFEKCIITINEMGNTSSASIPTAIYKGIKEGRITRNKVIAFASFGAGFSYGAGILPMVGLKKE